MSSRKRRRDQYADEDEVEPVPTEGETISTEKQRAEKEQEVWDAIREAHFEAIEQLPLTLQRQLSLMRQLDEQTLVWSARLLPTLQKYIRQRRTLAGISRHELHTLEDPSTTIGQSPDGNLCPKSDKFSPHYNAASPSSPATRIPGSVPPELSRPPETTREMLSHVAWMAEELLRASQEKVNLSQANYDSVERHIRLLDQAIEEQEASLSPETIRSSIGTGMILPELKTPELPRKGRNAAPTEVDDELEGNDSASLVITIPPHPVETLYCYCNRISFGEMIGCDSETCEREWFHLGCVGLTKPPGGEWFCEDCRTDEL